MSALNALTYITPENFFDVVSHLLKVDTVPFIKSPPGMGKSAMIADLADRMNLYPIDQRLSMFENVDMKGYPHFNPKNARAEYVPFDSFPLDDEEIPEGYDGFLIFLDEVTHASPEVIRATYELVYDRKIGGHPIHPKAHIIMAGNRAEDNALASDMGTAMNSRVVHLELVTSYEHYVTVVAPIVGLDERVASYILANPEHLNDFDPDNTTMSFCCQRTWERVSRIIKGQDDLEVLAPAVCGAITPSVGTSFLGFVELYDKLPSLKDIAKDPENIALVQDSAGVWASLYMVSQAMQDDRLDVDAGVKYAGRYPMQFIAMFWKMTFVNPKMFSKVGSSKEVTALARRVGHLVVNN